MESDRARAHATVQIDNESVIVAEWRFPPGGSKGWHRHAYDYVAVPLRDGNLQLETTEGQRISELRADQSYFRGAGVEHNVVDSNEYEFIFIEIELKQTTP